MLTAWVPFHDVDETSGSIAFVPGSHRSDVEGLDFFDQDLDRLEGVAQPAILRRGQVSFHHCRTIHGSGPNRSAWPRRSLAIHLQPTDTRHRGGRHRNDDLCRQRDDGTPDYTDPALFPVLWPA